MLSTASSFIDVAVAVSDVWDEPVGGLKPLAPDLETRNFALLSIGIAAGAFWNVRRVVSCNSLHECGSPARVDRGLVRD